MKKLMTLVLALYVIAFASAEKLTVSSPDNQLQVQISQDARGAVFYQVTYQGKVMLEDSPLGMITNVNDFGKQLKLIDSQTDVVKKSYTQSKIKQSQVDYLANQLVCNFVTRNNQRFSIVFRVSNNNIAFKYVLPQNDGTTVCVVEEELTGFKFPASTTTFLTPQSKPMVGWMRTKPSYEEGYIPDDVLGAASGYGVGYTFPGLFHIGDDGWVLVSETGVSSQYCASKLGEPTREGLYTVAFPEPGENNGLGSAKPGLALPGETPWRTITVGNSLKPIVETTIPFDVVEPLYEASQEYQFGRSTWSWIMWQDQSMNYDDQVTYIDLAAEMGYEYILIDALWDKQLGYERLESLIKYAQSKGVDVFLWYNSNGYWNDAPQGPKQKMHNAIVRKKEMQWLQSVGVKGLKVDFFGGDKQVTMKLYEDILSDANDYGLMCIFHGCTLPRGWERMYPNYVGSEAVLASENLVFSQHANDTEAYNACLHPFIRNAVGCMEFGPVLLNKRHNRNNDGGSIRRTTETFQLATAVLFQSPVQMFAITPNNLKEYPAFVIDFMKDVPTTWDETVFIDGYPGKYVVLARRHLDKWYVVGLNAEKTVKTIKINLPMFAGKKVDLYQDKDDRTPDFKNVSIKKSGEYTVTIQSEGAVIFVSN